MNLDALLSQPVYDLSQPFFNGCPAWVGHPIYRIAFASRHGDVLRGGGYSSATELINLSSHSGTHIDALAHISEYGKLCGGIDAAENQIGPSLMKEGGVERIPVGVRRGVLFDVAGHRGESAIEVGEGISGAELEEIARKQEIEVHAGDVVLIRTGWGRFWNDPERYLGAKTGAAGPNVDAARWLAVRKIFMTGADTITYEWRPPEPKTLAVHIELIVRSGIHLLENANLETLAADKVREFLIVANPLLLNGATGGQVRPIAIPLRG
ncbi:MAG: cyclase family protein [Chloroflexi bacterium]|nr:cyclase family protein [Chloroflexota bacterium]